MDTRTIIGLMECVHTHQGIHVIEGSHIQSIVKKTEEANWKFGKIGRTINQAPTLGPKHDKIWT
jgi:hypothetical protein